MARKVLTARFVDSARVDVRTDFWDDLVRGLVFRVSPTGAKSWTAVYTRESDGAKRRVTLGKYPALSLEKARSKALAVMSRVGEGEDPAAGKRARRDALTVEDLGKLYVEKYAQRNKRTWKEDERLLKVEVYPAIGRMKSIAVKRRDILDIIEAKAEAGYPAQSPQFLAVVRKMFNWAVDSDYLETSPATGIRPRAKPVRRERVLSDAELAAIWNALPEAPISAVTREIIRLLFLTGQRSGEVCGMRRSEVEIDNATWTIPGDRTKNGRSHVVPLSAPALRIISEALDLADDDPDTPIFSRVGAPIESNAIAQAVRKNFQLFTERWTPHDARRTVATGMATIGIQPHIIEATLNHISGFRAGVAGVYNRALYEPEKRRALDIWANYVKETCSGKNRKIIPLKKI